MADNKFQAKGFLIWGLCCLFFLYEFFMRTVIGSYQHSLMQDLKLTSFEFSLLSTTIFSLIYGFMQVPVGIIIDNIGLKKSLIIGAIFCAISSIIFSYSTTYIMAMISRMFMGVGASFGFICVLVSVCDWMPNKYNALFIGLSQFIGTLGPMFSAGPLNSISKELGASWRSLFFSLGLFGVVLVILIFLFVENRTVTKGDYTILNKPEKIITSFVRLFSRIQPWYIAFLSAGLYFSVEYLSANEGRSFLLLKGINITSASYMLTISWIGYAIGAPSLGFLSDILERRKIIMALSAILGLISILMVFYLSGELFLQVAFFLLGISASGQSIGFAAMAEQFKKNFIAIGFGLNNGMISFFSAINAPAIGFLLDTTKKNQVPTLDEYLFVFDMSLVIPAIATCIIAIFLIKETYCKSLVDFTIVNIKKLK